MIEHIDKLDTLKLKQSGGVYERQETNLFKRLLKSNDIFVDVGAHIGYYTDIAAEIIKHGKVYAFEPEPGNFALLEKNIKKHSKLTLLEKNAGKEDFIKLYNRGVGNKYIKQPIYISETNSRDHRAFPTPGQERTKRDISFVRLDDFITEGEINFLKIDVQGYEVDVLEGAENILINSPDINIIIEYSPSLLRTAGRTPGEFIAMLIDRNFHIYAKYDGAWQYATSETYHHKKGQFHTNFFCSRKTIGNIDWGEK